MLRFFKVTASRILDCTLYVCVCVCVSYWQANVKGSRHPAQDGRVHVLRPVSGSHHHHLQAHAHLQSVKYDTRLQISFEVA